MQLPVEKKEENFQRHKANAERGSRNATGHDTHNGTLENVEVYYALIGAFLACTRLILHDCSCTNPWKKEEKKKIGARGSIRPDI